jgi:hypothetical protein
MAPSAGVVHGRWESVGVNLPAGRHRARLDNRDALAGLPARFRDLAVTRTDLLVGAALTRYPLEGMWAWVEDDTNGVTYLRIEGPAVALLRKVRHRRDATLPLAMRAWAQTLNLHARGNHQPGMSA